MPVPAWISAALRTVDLYILAIVGAVVAATLMPARGMVAVAVDDATLLAIALLFFLYGGRLSREAVVAGMLNWRLQLFVVGCTFVLFPLIGGLVSVAISPLVDRRLSIGILFLCLLPSTVQSSIAFTAMARGNVAAAVCAASLSNLLGTVVTPLLVDVLLRSGGGQGSTWATIRDVVLQLIVPFALGQVLRPWIGPVLQRHRGVLAYVDRGSIVLIVYASFSAGVVAGIWGIVGPGDLGLLLIADAVILGLMLVATRFLARHFGLGIGEEIVAVFCGSKKSLASGVPLTNILFSKSEAGLVILPLMLFHQMQLMVCAVLARRYGARPN